MNCSVCLSLGGICSHVLIWTNAKNGGGEGGVIGVFLIMIFKFQGFAYLRQGFCGICIFH